MSIYTAIQVQGGKSSNLFAERNLNGLMASSIDDAQISAVRTKEVSILKSALAHNLGTAIQAHFKAPKQARGSAIVLDVQHSTLRI
jgi:hypothetical protein